MTARALAVGAITVFGGAAIVPTIACFNAAAAVGHAEVVIASAVLLSAMVAMLAVRMKTPGGAAFATVILVPSGVVLTTFAVEVATGERGMPDFVGAALLGVFLGAPFGFVFAPIVYGAVSTTRQPSHDQKESLLGWIAAYFAFASWFGASRLGGHFLAPAIVLGVVATVLVVALVIRDSRRLETIEALRHRVVDRVRVIPIESAPSTPEERVVPLVSLAGVSFDAIVVRDRVTLGEAYRTGLNLEPVAFVTRDLTREEATVRARRARAVATGVLIVIAAFNALPRLASGSVRRGLIDAYVSHYDSQRVHRIHSAMQIYRDESPDACPTVSDLREAGMLDRNESSVDQWGSPFALRCDGEKFGVFSAGRDRRWGTLDDIDSLAAGP